MKPSASAKGRSRLAWIALLAGAMALYAKADFEQPAPSDRIQTLTPLEEIEELLSQPERIRGLEMILVRAGGSAPEFFGHVFLRLLSEKNPTLDPAFSFNVALKPGVKGMAGGFAGVSDLRMEISTFGILWHSYVVKSNREVERLLILSSPENRAKLASLLLALIKIPEKMGRYRAASNNCVTLLIELLGQSGFPVASAPSVTPRSVFQYLFDSGLSPFEPLKMRRKPVLKPGYDPDRLNEAQAKTLLAFDLLQDQKQIRSLRDRYPFRPGSLTYLQVIGYAELPSLLYSLCAAEPCASEVASRIKDPRSEVRYAGFPKDASELALSPKARDAYINRARARVRGGIQPDAWARHRELLEKALQ